MQCRICGSDVKVEFRTRSRMTLCERCHRTTPQKVGYDDFITITGLSDDRTGKEFYDDYKTSNCGSVVKYWNSCTVST